MSMTTSLPIPYTGDEPFIFLSYSHRNADLANAFIRSMNRMGFRVWYDEGLIPGREWDETIARVIMRSSYFIALLSEDYLASSNCRDELNYARDKNLPQVLVYLEEVSLPAGMELRLGRLMAVHLSKYPDMGSFYSKVISSEGIDICRNLNPDPFDPTEPDAQMRPIVQDLEPLSAPSPKAPSHAKPAPKRRSRLLPVVLVLLVLAVVAAWVGLPLAKRVYRHFKNASQTGGSYQYTAPAYEPEPQYTYEPSVEQDPNAVVVADESATPVPTEEIYTDVVTLPEEPLPEEIYTPEETYSDTPAEQLIEETPAPTDELIVDPAPEAPSAEPAVEPTPTPTPTPPTPTPDAAATGTTEEAPAA